MFKVSENLYGNSAFFGAMFTAQNQQANEDMNLGKCLVACIVTFPAIIMEYIEGQEFHQAILMNFLE